MADRADDPTAVFGVLADWLRDQDRGCAFVNAYAEIGGTDHPAVEEIRAEKEWMRGYLVELTGDHRLGGELHLLYEGATVLHTAAGDVEAVERAKAAAVRLLAG